jgi:hypothetical protein
MPDTPVYCTGVGMIHLEFTAPLEGEPREVCAEAFVLRGGQLEKQPQAEPVAFSLSDTWELERARFARLECSERVLCLFEEDGSIGEKQGPFSGLAVVKGTLRCGERLIATLRGSYWQSEKTRRAWPRVRVVEG